ncbi:MAG: hypothetical protein AAGE65_00485 [Planctomycetota bacterium]
MERCRWAWGVVGVACVGVTPSGANAATLTWDGGGATDAINDALNWSPDLSPTPLDDATIDLPGVSAFATDDLFFRTLTLDGVAARNSELTNIFTNPAEAYPVRIGQGLTVETAGDNNASLLLQGVARATSGVIRPALLIDNGPLVLERVGAGAGTASLTLNNISNDRPSVVQVRGAGSVQLGDGGVLAGSGQVLVIPGPSAIPDVGLDNNGLIQARYAGPVSFTAPIPLTTLELRVGATQTIDLDGASNFGEVLVSPRATLSVQSPLTDVFRTEARLGDESVLDVTLDWSATGTIRAGTVEADVRRYDRTATLRGGTLTLLSDGVRVGNLTADDDHTFVVEADVVAAGGGAVAFADATLRFEGDYTHEALSILSPQGVVDFAGGGWLKSGSFVDFSNAPGRLIISGAGGLNALAISRGVGIAALDPQAAIEVRPNARLFFGDESGSSADTLIQPALFNDGTVEVGFDSGTTLGDFTQSATGTLEFRSDAFGGDLSRLAVTGDVALDGTLALTLDENLFGGFDSYIDQQFVIMIALSQSASITGGFDDVVLQSFFGGTITELRAEIDTDATVDLGFGGATTLVDAVTVTFRAAGLLGDFNGSGRVEQGDLNLVLNNWGSDRGDWANADGFASVQVDQEELNAVLNNWGAAAAPSFTANPGVPEPGVAALVGLAALTVSGRSRRR